jgi:hypothetical protein
MRASTTALVIFATFGVLFGAGCASKEAFSPTVSYVLEPTRQLPEGLHNVAVLDDGIKVEVTDDGPRSKKWAKISADMMEQMILDSNQKFGANIQLAKRRETGKVMAESDLKNSGLAAGGSGASAKLADVQALIACQLNIQVEVNKSTKTTFDVTNVAAAAGHYWGGGSASVTPREADAINRNITLQCKFSMLDAGTSKAIYEYAPKPLRKHDSKKPGAFFGRSAGEADLDPVDMYIGELVEQGTREFVSTFVPCQVEYKYDLSSGDSKESAAGIRAMRADNLEAAVTNFKAAISQEPNDDKSAFALGVTYELMHDWENALKCYRQAAAMSGVSEKTMVAYLAAKDRVAAHKDRIRKADKKA